MHISSWNESRVELCWTYSFSPFSVEFWLICESVLLRYIEKHQTRRARNIKQNVSSTAEITPRGPISKNGLLHACRTLLKGPLPLKKFWSLVWEFTYSLKEDEIFGLLRSIEISLLIFHIIKNERNTNCSVEEKKVNWDIGKGKPFNFSASYIPMISVTTLLC